ncbi:MAG: type II secretion system F family protein [Lentisphaerae bacterium]|nr:type II secretion system F family protein [Lentisphaerota bacterium]
MKTFTYRGYDRAGRLRKGLIEALGVKDARETLAARGILAERLQASGRRAGFRAATRAMVYRELGALLRAGLPLVRALDILIDSPELGGARALLAGVRDRIREGVPLVTALAEGAPSVTAFEQAVLEAGERSATVDVMLERLADFIEEQERVVARIRQALIYPSIVVVAGICVAVVMLGVLAPRARALLADSGAAMPALTAGMIRTGAFLARWGWAVLAAVAAAVWGAQTALRRRVGTRDALERRLFALPWLGRGLTALANFRFARTLAILTGGGVSPVDGMALAGRATGSAWIARCAAAESRAVQGGAALAEAVSRIEPLAVTLPGWIRIGEATGDLARLLERAAARYEAAWERFLARGLALLEPVLILLIGGFVLLVTVSVLLPVFSLTRAIGAERWKQGIRGAAGDEGGRGVAGAVRADRSGGGGVCKQFPGRVSLR